jgi:hypothetical protein
VFSCSLVGAFRFGFKDFQAPESGTLALKNERLPVDTLNSMIRITLMDGNQLEIPREEAVELLPYQNVLRSSHLKDPVDGLISYRGKLVPVLGPMPETADVKDIDRRPWLLLMKGCAQVVQGLPIFSEAVEGSNVIPFRSSAEAKDEALDELDELLKKSA